MNQEQEKIRAAVAAAPVIRRLQGLTDERASAFFAAAEARDLEGLARAWPRDGFGDIVSAALDALPAALREELRALAAPRRNETVFDFRTGRHASAVARLARSL